ncbi:hypothetical protein FBU30_004398 [Linnemannia zychae]|nr:hypothetical protein FBU30_004398 [Linnemannia zychae]
MDPSSTPRTNPRKGLRRPDYGLLQQREFKRTVSRQFDRIYSTVHTDISESHLTSFSSHETQQDAVDDQVRQDTENDNPFLTIESREQNRSTQRTINTKTGLRRPDYGPMQSHVFRNQPATPHVIKRRTIVDESLIEALIQTHLRGPTAESTSHPPVPTKRDDATNSQQTAPLVQQEPIWDGSLYSATVGVNDYWDSTNPPQTPKRESRTFIATPGSGRRTPRRRSRSSNQHLRTTPIKALADANEARVNRLISEANRRGRVGRDKHSPMGILRQLSRIPGFNPPPKPSPDREPIPGSANWRKLTPRSTRVKHIDISGEVNNPFKSISSNNDKKSFRDSELSSRNSNHANISSAKRRLIDRLENDNPFLTPEDYSRLWEEDIDMARNQSTKGRESFGLAFPGGSAGDFLLGDDDTRDFNIALQDLTDPFLEQVEFRDRSLHIGDITNNSAKGFEDLAAQGGDRSQEDQSAHQGTEHEKSYSEEALKKDAMDLANIVAVEGNGDDQDENINMNDEWEDIPDDELTQDYPSQQGLQADVSKGQLSGSLYESIHKDANEEQNLVNSSSNGQSSHALDNSGTSAELRNSDKNFAIVDIENIGLLDTSGDKQELPAESPEGPIGDVNEWIGSTDVQHGDVHGKIEDSTEQLDNAGEKNRDSRDLNNVITGNQDSINNGDHDVETHNDLDMEIQNDLDIEVQNDLDLETEKDQEFENGYMDANEEGHIEQQEHEDQQGKTGIQYFDDFPSELGIMSNGNILPTSLPKTKKVIRHSRRGIPIPSMPTSLQKQLIHTFSRSRMSREAMDVVLEGSHLFFEQASNDLAAYADHAGRKTIDETDVELLMKRLRIIHDKVSMESLLQRYLPRELRDKVLFPEDMPSANSRRY